MVINKKNTQKQYIDSFAIMLIDENDANNKGDPKFKMFFKRNSQTTLENFIAEFSAIPRRILKKYPEERWEEISGVASLDAAADVLLKRVYEMLRN